MNQGEIPRKRPARLSFLVGLVAVVIAIAFIATLAAGLAPRFPGGFETMAALAIMVPFALGLIGVVRSIREVGPTRQISKARLARAGLVMSITALTVPLLVVSPLLVFYAVVNAGASFAQQLIGPE